MPGELVLTYLGGGRLSFLFSGSDLEEERRRKNGSLYVFLLSQDANDGGSNMSLFSRSDLEEERRRKNGSLYAFLLSQDAIDGH